MPNKLIIEIVSTDDGDVIVADTRYGITEYVDLGMNPTWPNALEVSDMVANAVRKIMDQVYTADTGDVIER